MNEGISERDTPLYLRNEFYIERVLEFSLSGTSIVDVRRRAKLVDNKIDYKIPIGKE